MLFCALTSAIIMTLRIMTRLIMTLMTHEKLRTDNTKISAATATLTTDVFTQFAHETQDAPQDDVPNEYVLTEYDVPVISMPPFFNR